MIKKSSLLARHSWLIFFYANQSYREKTKKRTNRIRSEFPMGSDRAGLVWSRLEISRALTALSRGYVSPPPFLLSYRFAMTNLTAGVEHSGMDG